MNPFLLLLFWMLWYVNYISRTILAPLLPLIEDALHINHAQAGGLFLPFYIGSTLSVLFAGFLSLRLGYKNIILACFFVLAICFSLLSFIRSYHLFIVVTFFLGLGSGLYIPCAIPLLTAVISRNHWGKVISFHETAAGCAILTVPFWVVFALRFMVWHSIFLVMGVLCLGVTFFIMAFSPDPRPKKVKQSVVAAMFKRSAFWIITTVFITCGIASMGIYNIIPLFLVKERGMPLDWANTFFSISRIGGFVAMIFIGFILDRLNLKKVLFFLVLATGIFTLMVAAVNHHWLLLAILFFQATFSVVVFPVVLIVVSKISSQNERGMYTAITMAAAGIFGPGLSPIVLGAIADVWSFQTGILMVGVLTTASCICIRWLKEI